MSTETMADTPKLAKTKKNKDDKSAKKRRHDEQATPTAQPAAEEASETTLESLPKRPRIASPAADDATSTSPFVKQTSSFYLPLSPIYHAFPVDGLCAEHISPLLLTYHPPLRGVILS
ncbi:hypothetical protein KCU73_g10440, partial [Aureobasidium melanogenum]